MISEWWIWKEVEGCGTGLNWDPIPVFNWTTWLKLRKNSRQLVSRQRFEMGPSKVLLEPTRWAPWYSFQASYISNVITLGQTQRVRKRTWWYHKLVLSYKVIKFGVNIQRNKFTLTAGCFFISPGGGATRIHLWWSMQRSGEVMYEIMYYCNVEGAEGSPLFSPLLCEEKSTANELKGRWY
jgi:hypothetical protein